MTQNNLANAYSNRIRGEKAENIELAIKSYTAALTIRTPEASQLPTMDETRDRAYRQLIQTLLTCPNGEENQILNANSELVDAELVQTMVAVAAQLSENNQEIDTLRAEATEILLTE